MATAHPRIQVTVDPELAQALAAVDPGARSRSRVVRDLALRGAQAIAAEGRASQEAAALLKRIAAGDDGYDFSVPAALVAERSERLP